jgi:3'5'-cyclic nucleotide phosphodiesterase
VSNAQLVKEGVHMATMYKNRSVAEQNSFDLSYNLLLDPMFGTLRKFLFPTETELVRFRQLVVNSVMATDIVDQDLKALRNARWDKAFKNATGKEDPRDAVNRKATIVIEHIIQASDISHTMQVSETCFCAFLHGTWYLNPIFACFLF